MEKELTITAWDGKEMTLRGTDEEIKKALIVLGEAVLNNEELKEQNISMLSAIGEELYLDDKASPEELAAAKKFFEAAEEYKDPVASDYLSCMQDNKLRSDVMWLRAADRGAPSPVSNTVEEYEAQAAYWAKKIAEAEGKPFDGDAPDDKEILESPRLTFYNIYKRAFEGDLDAMKICKEFCEQEAAYWEKHPTA